MVKWEDLFEALAGRDPKQALQAATELPALMAREGALKAVLAQLANTDPEDAMQHAEAIAEPSVRASVQESVLKQWLQTDRSAAWEHVLKMPKGLARLRLAQEWGLQLAAEEASQARASIATVEDEQMRVAAWKGPAVALAKTDLDRARHALEQLQGDFSGVGQQRIYFSGGSGGSNFQAALARAAKTVVMHLAESDAAAALDFVVSMNSKSSMFEHDLGTVIGKKLVRDDPAYLAERLGTLPDSSLRNSLTMQLTRELPDPLASLKWANDLEGTARGTALNSLLQRLGSSDLATVVSAIPEFEAMEAEKQAAVLETWVDSSQMLSAERLEEARQWLTTHPEHEAFSRAYSNFTNQMARTNLDQAVEFVENLEASPRRQGAIGGLLGHLGNSSPMDYDAMIYWIGQSQSEKTQQFWLNIMAKDWMTKDPEAAIQWFGNSEWKPAEWDQMLSRHHRNQGGTQK